LGTCIGTVVAMVAAGRIHSMDRWLLAKNV